MDFKLLDSEEVRHECQIRGLPLEGSVSNLASNLNTIYAEEFEGRRLYKPVHVNTVSQEMETLLSKVDDLKRIVEHTVKSGDKESERRALAKAIHCRGRIDNLSSRAPNLSVNVSNLNKDLKEIMDKLNVQQNTVGLLLDSSFHEEDMVHSLDTASAMNVGPGDKLPINNAAANRQNMTPRNNPQSGVKPRGNFRKPQHFQNRSHKNQNSHFNRNRNYINLDNQGDASRWTQQRNLNDQLNSAADEISRLEISRDSGSSPSDICMRLRNIANWGIKFNGQPTPITVEQFVKRVEILSVSEGIPFDRLCLSMHQLLTDNAKTWFWIYIQRNSNPRWNEFRSSFISEFQTITSDHEIRRMIENRRQKKFENFSDFKLAVEEINARLRNPYSESELVNLLKCNMHPALRKNLVLQQPNTVKELKLLCMQIEKGLADIGESLDDQLTTRKRFVNEVSCEITENDLTSVPLIQENFVEESSLTICWNCKDIGHNFIDCPVDQQRYFCYKCGAEGVTRSNCFKCNRLNRPADARLGNLRRPNLTSPQIVQPQILKRQTNHVSQSTQTETR